MAALARSALRQRVAAAIAALDGYDESRSPFALFFRDPNTRRHGAFAVRAGASEPVTRQQASNVMLTTPIEVAVSWKLKPKAQIESLDLALDAQEAIAVAVLGMSLASLQITLERLSEPLVESAGEWARIDLSFLVVHLCAVV